MVIPGGRFIDFCRGRSNRRSYATWGVGLFLFKWNLDRLIIGGVFHYDWLPWSYFAPVGNSSPWRDNPSLALLLAFISLPFVSVGVLLTLRRLRDAGWPLWIAVVFFLPFVNLAFFLTLSLTPSQPSGAAPPDTPRPAWLPRLFTFHSATASAAAAVALTVALAVPLVALGSLVLKNYGWGIFVGVPFVSGFFGALLHGQAAPRTWGQCCAVGFLIVFLTGSLLVLLAVEGLICILMAAPLALPLVLFGSTVGYAVQRERWNRRLAVGGSLYTGAWIFLPLLLAAEWQAADGPSFCGVTTVEEISAPPSVVWQHVVEFSELPPPTEPVFRSGIAYPVRARITGRGVGAVRHCEFSTGPFVEPITVWDEPRHLAFDVTAQPHPMRELSPYRALHPPHLDGFFRSRRGEFRLTALPGGRTRLAGTTWYEQRLWPAPYWQSWSDWLVHTIHARVLRHIKTEAEAAIARPT